MTSLEESNLGPRARAAALVAAEVLHARLGARQVILFGSAARGELGPESDVDLLVILPGEALATAADRRRVIGLLYPIVLERDVLLSAVVVSEREWNEGVYQATSLRREVDRDGVPLLPQRAAA
jgi:predicted nucleotidyltransferase